MAPEHSSPTGPAERPLGRAEDNPAERDRTERRVASLSEAAIRRSLRRRLERHGDLDPSSPAALTIVGLFRDGADVLARGIDRPENAVLEYVLPARYHAIGVLATSVVSTPPNREHRSGALAIGVGRSGEVVSLLATNDGIIDTREPQGWLIDACLRAVDRATRPSDLSPLAFPIVLWLDRLMVSLLNAPVGAPMTWDHAVELCPVPRRWRSYDAVDLGTTLASTTTSWSTLRAAAAQGRRSPVGVSPGQAAWMDDSMFARWCMGGFPEAASLRGDVEFLAPAEVAERVDIALRAARSAFADRGDPG